MRQLVQRCRLSFLLEAIDVGDDLVNLNVGELQLGHVVVRRDDGARYWLSERENGMTLMNVTKGRRRGMRAFVLFADGVTPGAILFGHDLPECDVL